MKKLHTYKTKVDWTGNLGNGTSDYLSYSRNHKIQVDAKYGEILASSDPAFRGDSDRYNPEELFLSALSACHMLWYLHLCSVHKIIVSEYLDNALGVMEENKDGSGRFISVTLHPEVTIENEDLMEKALALHEQANKMCFIANSCNFEVGHEPKVKVE